MTALRVILIAFAVVLLVAIYAWGRRSNKQARAAAALPESAPGSGAQTALPASSRRAALPENSAARLQPHISWADGSSGEPEAPAIEQSATAEPLDIVPPALESPEPTELGEVAAEPAHKILALRLVATVPRFSGAHLRTALEAESLHFGKYQIFHRTTPQDAVVFSVASMLEPGSFDLDQMFHEQYPGIVLFAQLPCAVDGLTVLSELISCARKLQQTLGGVVQDDLAAPLLAPRIEQLRKEVREFEAAQLKQSRNESAHP
jgi:cell division protein ZipA